MRRNPQLRHLPALFGLAMVACGSPVIAQIPDEFTNLKLHPESTDTHVTLGVIYLRDNQVESARTSFANALEIKPGHEGAAPGLEQVLEMEGES